MKKIAFKFLAVIGVLVAISLVSLQMMSMKIGRASCRERVLDRV